MLEKRGWNEEGKVLVTFRVNADAGDSVAVVGEFNGWSQTATLMERGDAGAAEFVASIVLDRGRAYRFRYLVDGRRWENDWAADDYVPNEYGGTDSVVDLRADPAGN